MKKLICRIACYTGACFLIFACEDANEVEMSQQFAPTEAHTSTKPAATHNQTIWFSFQTANRPDGRYKVGTNPSTGSTLFISLRNREVVQARIQTIDGLTSVLDPVGGPTGPLHVSFMCVDPEVIQIFTTRSSAINVGNIKKYTIYVVPKDCNPQSTVIMISMERSY